MEGDRGREPERIRAGGERKAGGVEAKCGSRSEMRESFEGGIQEKGH